MPKPTSKLRAASALRPTNFLSQDAEAPIAEATASCAAILPPLRGRSCSTSRVAIDLVISIARLRSVIIRFRSAFFRIWRLRHDLLAHDGGRNEGDLGQYRLIGEPYSQHKRSGSPARAQRAK